MTEFGRLTPEGYEHGRTIKQPNLQACPHFILVPEHYREDESRRCDDPGHIEMAEWGYTWSAQEGRWT